jgi:hypothetical protein
MSGKDYIAARVLSTRDGVVARVGERCDYVPVSSLPSLLASGKITLAPKAEPKAKKAKGV